METKFIDLHIHPALKPMGKSFNNKPGRNNPNKNRVDSIWHYDAATFLDKIINITTTLTKFRQSDFTSLAKGGAEVVFVSLCGLEKGFVMTKIGTGLPGDAVANLITGLSKKRIDHVQKMTDYFTDLEMEYDFYKQLDGHKVKIDGSWHRYKIVSSYNETEENQEPDVRTIFVILTIEGMHVFNAGLQMIVSHGAVNGFRSPLEKVEDDLINYGKFQPTDINSFDNEIVRIAQSGGLFGIQLDERRLASEMELKKTGPALARRKMLFYKSKLVWNQIQHIAEVLNRHDQFAWGIQCIGSDYDGMIDPLNGFWGAEEMPLFDSYLEKHAYNFLESNQSDSLKDFNKLSASDIVERFLIANARDFLKKTSEKQEGRPAPLS